MSVVSVYAIFRDADEARSIAHAVIEARLAACANILPEIESIYRWAGKVESAREAAAIFKTSHDQVDALISRIAELHSYDVPCVVSWPIDRITTAYADWVERSVAEGTVA